MIPLVKAKSEFLSGYFATNDRSRKTEAAYAADLEQFSQFAGADADLSSLDSITVECWVAELRKKNYRPASIRRKIVALRVFFSYWLRRKTILESPFWRVKLSFGRIEQLPRALTESETRALLALTERQRGRHKPRGPIRMKRRTKISSASQYRAIRNLALLDLLFATGVRVGEASALDVRDFASLEGVFTVRGKGGRDRLAFAIDDRTMRIQREHLEARKEIETGNSALFLNAAGGRLSTQGIANVISTFRQRAGIERHITPHMLRHTVATMLLRNGADVRVVQEFLGHASIVTTQRYTHITKEHLISVLRKRHPSLRLRA